MLTTFGAEKLEKNVMPLLEKQDFSHSASICRYESFLYDNLLTSATRFYHMGNVKPNTFCWQNLPGP